MAPSANNSSLATPRSKRLRCSGPPLAAKNNATQKVASTTTAAVSRRQHSIALTKLEQLTCSCNKDDTERLSDNKKNKCDAYSIGNEETVSATVPKRAGKKAILGKKPANVGDGHDAGNTTDDHQVKQPPKHRKIVIQTLGASDRNVCKKHMPWFGIDVGGSLVKVVFFDPKEATNEELRTLQRIRQYLWSSKAYGSTGRRDAHLEMPFCLINGRAGSLHFIRFATSEMPAFLAMAKRKRFADDVNRTICATGGGACKFEREIRDNLGIRMHKTDEFDSIIYGIPYIDQYNSKRECYFLKDPLDEIKCTKVPYDFSKPYPYLVVNIGSGVSILAVYSRERYSRISGSSIGGGTFLGLCCLLTQCKTFDEAISLAVAGSSTMVDKLVKDIYGGDYPKFELSGSTVASAFGHMNLAERRKQVKREDLARALLEMVTNNIGSLARMCAVNHGIDRVVFIGNFLRANQLSMKLLSFALDYWSKGAIKALFLEHEGYFGAVGCFVESTQGCQAVDNE
jgi:type II pantothenate kinase